MKRHILFFLTLLLAVPLYVYSVPAKPGLKKTLKLADGTTIVAQLVGDEHGHYWLSNDGKAYDVVPGEDVYKQVDAQKIIEYAQEQRSQVNKQRVKRLPQRRAEKPRHFTGKKKGLIILVNFSDVSFKKKHDRDYFNRIANEKNFHDGDFKGSVYDYFYDQSVDANERFEVNFDVVGPYTVSQKREYYGAQIKDSNGKVMSKDSRAAAMVGEAVNLANNDTNIDINFGDYDWDGDKYVDLVYVIYAGKGQADSGIENTIWPHQSSLDYPDYWQEIDGVFINTYACSNELNGDGDIAGIGTICHEFSHCLGFPDFYDTVTDKYQGMGYWDLMAIGSYNGNGYQPAGYTSYERWAAGWKTPTLLSRSVSVSGMKSLQEGGESFIIHNPNHFDEYFLLENRQKNGWDASLPGFGMLILHVDYDEEAWNKNKVNVESIHQRMTWMPADAKYDHDDDWNYTFKGMATDTYPQPNNNSFNKDSNPVAWLHHPNTNGEIYLDSSVENITKNSDGTISFDYVFTDNLYVTALGFENWYPLDGFFDGTILNGSVTLKNVSDRNIKEAIKVRLVDYTTGIMKSFPIQINIDPDVSVEYDFSFSNLIVGHTYFVMVCYQSGTEFYRSDPMLCKDEDTGETYEGNEDLAYYEYWFDKNYAQRKTVGIDGSKAVVRASIATDELENGFHLLNFRVKRNAGDYQFSSVNTTPFLKLAKEQEGHLDYWIDDNRDAMKTLPLADTEDEQLLELDLSDDAFCPPGFHRLNIQVATKGSVMGNVQSQGVLKLSKGVAGELEYWFDNDLAHRQKLTGKRSSADDGYIYVSQLDLSALTPGQHRLNFRAVSPTGRTAGSVMSCTVMKLSTGKATQLEYWFDDDTSNRYFLDGDFDGDCYVYDYMLDMSGLPFGLHRLNIRPTSSDGSNKGSLVTCNVLKVGTGSVKTLEYWFDGDIAHSRTLGVQSAEGGTAGFVFADDLNLNGIAPGHHRLYCRAIGDDPTTTTAVVSYAVVVKSRYGADDTATMASYSLTLDNDSVVAYGQLSAKSEVVFNYTLDASELAEGTHTLKATFWNSFGASVTDVTPFWVRGSVDGDVNDDGVVGIGDIVAITNYMAGMTNGITLQKADVNGDGSVGIGDIVAITNIMAGVTN